jgi:hypothetical protein
VRQIKETLFVVALENPNRMMSASASRREALMSMMCCG